MTDVPSSWPVLTRTWSGALLEDLLARVEALGLDPEDWRAVAPIWNEVRAEHENEPQT